MNALAAALFLLFVQASTQPAPSATASVEGIVVKLGTNQPLAGVDVELSRIEGTAAAPVATGVTQAFLSAISGAGPGGSSPPSNLAPEIRYAKTGDDGRFAFRDLKEGKYRIAAARIGGMYYPGEYGQRHFRARGLHFPLQEGQTMRDARIEMAPTSTITGNVVDENGEPLSHVTVMALDPQYRQGQPRLYIDRSVLTDEHGTFRLYWLTPGPHYVAAIYEDPRRRTIETNERPPGRVTAMYRASAPVVETQVLPTGEIVESTYAVVYHGGGQEASQARLLNVAPGETIGGIDIAMGIGKMQSRRIRGVVLDAAGQPAAGAQVQAIPRQFRPNALILSAAADANGSFSLAGAVPDSYLLIATTSATAQVSGISPELLAAATAAGINVNQLLGTTVSQIGYIPIEMGGTDLENVRISTMSGINIPGQVVIEGRPPSNNDPDLARISIALTRDPDLIGMPAALMPLPPVPPPPPGTPQTPRAANGQVTGNGAFNLFMSYGDYRVSLTGLPSSLYVKSIRMGNTNVMAGGLRISAPPQERLEIVLGADGGTARGAILDERLSPRPNVLVALVPDLPEQRLSTEFYRSTTTDASGNFQLNTIPPGDYKLFTWDYVPADAWQNADFIRDYESVGRPLRITSAGKLEGLQLSVLPLR